MRDVARQEAEGRRRLTTVLAVDICGYSRLAEANERTAIKTVELVFAVFEKITGAHHGRIFNRAGDGFLAEFPSVADGVESALAFIAEIRSRNTLSPNALDVKVRAGLHVGDVTEQPNGDLLGHGVNIAARLQSEAEPNGLLLSLHAVNHVRDKVDAQFRRRGPLALKNIDEPVVAFDISSASSSRPFISYARNLFHTQNLRRGALLIVGILIVGAIFQIQSRQAEFARKQQKQFDSVAKEFVATRKRNQEIERAIIDAQNSASDKVQLLAISDAVDSLLQSEVPAKRRAVELITNHQIANASDTLRRVFEDQVAAKTKRSAQMQTLRERGAIVFNFNFKDAVEVYELLNQYDPKDPIASYQLGVLYLREGKPRDALSQFYSVSKYAAPESIVAFRSQLGTARARLMALRRDYGEIDLARDGPELDAIEALIIPLMQEAIEQRLVTEEAEIWNIRANIEDMRDNDRQAVVYQASAVSLLEGDERKPEYVAALADLGAITMSAVQLKQLPETQYQIAEDYLLKALQLSDEIKDRTEKNDILVNLAYLKQYQSDFSASTNWAREALAIAREENRNNSIGHLLSMMGSNAQEMNQTEEACTLLNEAQQAYLKTPYRNAPPSEIKLREFGCRG